MERFYVERLLDQEYFDIKSIAKIFGQNDFSKLIDLIYKLDERDQRIIFSQNKKFNQIPILRDQELNANGLHVFRMLLANIICRNNLENSDGYAQQFYQDGFLVLKDFLNEKDFKRIARSATQHIENVGNKRFTGKKYWIDLSEEHGIPYEFFNFPQSRIVFQEVNFTEQYIFHARRIERLIHKNNDIQKEIHEDTFHPTVKCWYFYQDVDVASGPTYYSKGSSVPTLKRFAWEYKKSLTAHLSENQGTAEGSFRAQPQDLHDMGYPSMEPVLCPKNTLIVFNTMGFHQRGQAVEGTIRDSLMCIFRMNPFI